MNFLRCNFKIPKNINIVKSKNKLYIIGPQSVNVLAVSTKIVFFYNRNYELCLKITSLPLQQNTIFRKSKLKMLQSTACSLIKYYMKNALTGFINKLRLVGIGYKVFIISKKNFKLLCLKLGYSHNIYCIIPPEITVTCPSPTTIFIAGKNSSDVHRLSSVLKTLKLPEVYKGKGVLFENENIKLKEGKKI